jgi:hypothetical protein
MRLLFVIGLAPLSTRLVVRLSPHLQNVPVGIPGIDREQV